MNDLLTYMRAAATMLRGLIAPSRQHTSANEMVVSLSVINAIADNRQTVAAPIGREAARVVEAIQLVEDHAQASPRNRKRHAFWHARVKLHDILVAGHRKIYVG